MTRRSRLSPYDSRPFDPDDQLRSLRSKKLVFRSTQTLYALLLLSSLVLLGWAFHAHWSPRNLVMCAGFSLMCAALLWSSFTSLKKVSREIIEMERLKEHLKE